MIEKDFNSFKPVDYLKQYYSEVDSENEDLLCFFANTYNNIPKDASLLEFGNGPTIYSLISASRNVKSIYVADYLEDNINEVKKWLVGEGFDWTNFIRKALKCEGIEPTEENINKRSHLLRAKINVIGRCDAFNKEHLLQAKQKKYDVVASNFCAESITSSEKLWAEALRNIFSLLKTNGMGVVTALKGAESYMVLNKSFPATNISENSLKSHMVSLGFDKTKFSTKIINISEDRGYKGIIMLSAKKSHGN